MPFGQSGVKVRKKVFGQIEIETYMAAIGFTKISNDGRFSNGEYEVWDLVPRNVLKDKEGDIFIIDAEIKLLQL